jgi:hypothetical protein
MKMDLMVVRRGAIAALLSAALAACAGDSPLAPRPAVPDLAAALASAQNISRLGFQAGTDTLVGTWVIPVAQASVQRLGAHMVTFPDHAICDPATSSYGPALWDAPCTPATQPVELTVHAWMDLERNVVRLSFTPDIRFVPSDDPERWVRLFLKEKIATDESLTGDEVPNIVWLPFADGAPVDESLTDPTLETQVSPLSGYLWRRVKHFSGYTVAAGRASVTVDTGVGVDIGIDLQN